MMQVIRACKSCGQTGVHQIKAVMLFYEEFHPGTVAPVKSKANEGVTEDVLIDVDGERTTFLVGWYDHSDRTWRLYSDGSAYVTRGMKWAYLPLRLYETVKPVCETVRPNFNG